MNKILLSLLIISVGFLSFENLQIASTLSQPLIIIPSDKDILSQWIMFKQNYKKSYTVIEELYRFEVFKANLNSIAQLQPALNFTVGVTRFSDLSDAEFQAFYLTSWPEIQKKIEVPNYTLDQLTAIPASVDWSAVKGKVTGIEDQGQCGAGYAFAAVSSIESAFSIFQGTQVILSKGQVVQCSQKSGNLGCNGGFISNTYKYAITYPLGLESIYAYTSGTGLQGLCNSKVEATGKYLITQSVITNSDGDCNGLQNSVSIQPTVVNVDASYFKFYKDGIFDKCGKLTNFVGLLVGYNNDYWKVKISFGADWGEEGYIRISQGNTCGICTSYGVPSVI